MCRRFSRTKPLNVGQMATRKGASVDMFAQNKDHVAGTAACTTEQTPTAVIPFQRHVPKYMPNTTAAPRKAPSVWKKKNNGSFLQGSLPSKHSVKVTAGFRWPPKRWEKYGSRGLFFYTCMDDPTLCDSPTESKHMEAASSLVHACSPLHSPFSQWDWRNSSEPTVQSVIAVSVKSCSDGRSPWHKLNWRDEKIQESILPFLTLKGEITALMALSRGSPARIRTLIVSGSELSNYKSLFSRLQCVLEGGQAHYKGIEEVSVSELRNPL